LFCGGGKFFIYLFIPTKLSVDLRWELVLGIVTQTNHRTTSGNLFCAISNGKSEKCRALAIGCLQTLILASIYVGRHIPDMIPALCARLLQCIYNKEMEVSIQNLQMHEFHKREGATEVG
jgi:hypothetical protein